MKENCNDEIKKKNKKKNFQYQKMERKGTSPVKKRLTGVCLGPFLEIHIQECPVTMPWINLN
jgi:hypothetical protein